MSLARLTRGDVIAAVAALALLFAMAADWYSTKAGEEARRIEGISQPEGSLGGEVERTVRDRASERGESQEKNAWQADAFVDRLLLVVLLAAVVLALAAAALRVAGRRFGGALTPSAGAALAAALGTLLIGYRMVQEPGLDAAATIEIGIPLALVALAVLALGAVSAMRAEESGTAWEEPASEGAPAAEPKSAARTP